MINENFVLAGVLLQFIGTATYLIPTLKGKVKPNRVTWFLWALAPLIAFAAEIKQGVGIQSLMTFSVGFSPFIIFIASFLNRKSKWKIGKIDILCAVLSIAGLILWSITKEGNIAITFSIFADFAAATPTILKSLKAPETEDYRIFLLSVGNSLIALAAIRIWTFAHYGFPLYILFICTVFVVLIKFRIGRYFLNHAP